MGEAVVAAVRESLVKHPFDDVACDYIHTRILGIVEHLGPIRRSAGEHGSVAREDPHGCRVDARRSGAASSYRNSPGAPGLATDPPSRTMQR